MQLSSSRICRSEECDFTTVTHDFKVVHDESCGPESSRISEEENTVVTREPKGFAAVKY